jgi:hypothetical protein
MVQIRIYFNYVGTDQPSMVGETA